MALPDRNIAILGPPASGKSLLIKLIAGTERPDTGRVTRHCTVSWPTGFRGSFHRDLTGAQNVRFLARIYGQNTEQMLEFVQDFAEMGAEFHDPVTSYTGNMIGKLAFGTCMAMKFDLYLVDGGTTVGDDLFKDKAERLFDETVADARVIMASPNIKKLRQHCDSAILLDRGEFGFFEDFEEGLKTYRKLYPVEPKPKPGVPASDQPSLAD